MTTQQYRSVKRPYEDRLLYECQGCGAIVADMTRHSLWHQRNGLDQMKAALGE